LRERSGIVLRMVAIETDEHEIRVNIPTDGMSPEAVSKFVNWLRVELIARRSRLADEAAWQISEDIKADWWARNKVRLIERTP
jgi:hypothetical protein